MLTNKYNLPEPIPTIIKEGGHAPKPNRYSVTDLIGPPLIRTLKLKHYDELASDCADYLWMLLGTAVDNMLTQNLVPDDNLLVQHKMEYEIDGNTIVGVTDVIRNEIIEDWKVTSTYTLKNEERITEYVHQLNMYAFLLGRTSDMRAKGIKIQAYLRDWVAGKANIPGYPKAQLHTIDLTNRLLNHKDQEDMVLNRLVDHIQNPMRECTPAEKWQKLDTFAVMKKGRKSAVRVLNSQSEADDWVKYNAPKGSIEIVKRPGACFRCENYCSVSGVCPYFNGDK